MKTRTVDAADKENTLASQCLDILQDEIVNGQFLPGQKLKVAELKERFAIGQSPIREALSRLVASGLVEAEDNKGFRVARISEAEVRDTYHTLFQIEMLAIDLAMERGDDAWESRVVAALHHLWLVEHKNEAVPYQLWSERNYAFHVALLSGCMSPLLMQVRAALYVRFDRFCRISFNLRHAELVVNHAEHKELADAILKRDVARAHKVMKGHAFGSMEMVIATLKQHKLLWS